MVKHHLDPTLLPRVAHNTQQRSSTHASANRPAGEEVPTAELKESILSEMHWNSAPCVRIMVLHQIPESQEEFMAGRHVISTCHVSDLK